MKKSEPSSLPSDAELSILKILWERGAATAKEIHEELNAGRKTPRVVTTTAKFLQIMLAKKLVTRDESTWPQTYKARAARETVLRGFVSKTLTQVFDKSASQFMLRALESGSVDASEIADIKAMLEAYEKGQDK